MKRPREPVLIVRIGDHIVYSVRLDELLRIEGYHSGRAPLVAKGFPFAIELTELTSEGKTRIVAQASYTAFDFPVVEE